MFRNLLNLISFHFMWLCTEKVYKPAALLDEMMQHSDYIDQSWEGSIRLSNILTKEVILCSLDNAFLFQGSWELHNTRSSQPQKPNYLILRKQYLHAIRLLTWLMWVVWISAWRILACIQLHMCKFWQGLVLNHVNLEALLSLFSAANVAKL